MTATAQDTDRKPQYRTCEDVGAEFDVHPDTVRRWIVRGLLVAGQVVRLRALHAGTKWRIPREAVTEFLQACNPEAQVQLAQEQEERRREQLRQRRAAARELERRLNKRGKP